MMKSWLYVGTGGEDYFNGAWGFSKLYSLPLVGLTDSMAGNRARAFRFTAGTWRLLSGSENQSK